MLLIFGEKDQFELLGRAPVACPGCHASPAELYRARRKLTIYFVPTLTVSSSYLLCCPNCQRRWQVDGPTGERLLAQITAAQPGTQRGAAPGASSPAAGNTATQVRRPGYFCGRCGKQLPLGARFCQECGAAVNG